MLEKLEIGRVLLDSRPIYNCPDDPQVSTERRKPQLPLQPSLTAPFSLICFISHPHQQFNQPFLENWATLVDGWLSRGTQIYFFVHCPIEEHSPENARYFQSLLERQDIPVPPLPWNNLSQPPTQLI